MCLTGEREKGLMQTSLFPRASAEYWSGEDMNLLFIPDSRP